jgi:hypothetical protein
MVGFVMIAGRAVGEDGDLTSVEQPLADAVVLFGVLEGFGPASCAGECAGAVGEQDGPQPLGHCATICIVDQVSEVHCVPLNNGVGLGLDRVEQRVQEVVGGVAVAVADEESTKVDERLQGELGVRRAERAGGAEDVELSVAECARVVGQSGVAEDQRGQVVRFRGTE